MHPLVLARMRNPKDVLAKQKATHLMSETRDVEWREKTKEEYNRGAEVTDHFKNTENTREHDARFPWAHLYHTLSLTVFEMFPADAVGTTWRVGHSSISNVVNSVNWDGIAGRGKVNPSKLFPWRLTLHRNSELSSHPPTVRGTESWRGSNGGRSHSSLAVRRVHFYLTILCQNISSNTKDTFLLRQESKEQKYITWIVCVKLFC